MKILGRIRILPLLIVVAFFSLSVRVSDIAENYNILFNVAEAKQEVEAKAPEFPDSGKAETIHDDVKEKPLGDEKLKQAWPDSSDMDLKFSSVKMELFKDLSIRRDKLDARENGLIRREALLQAAEKELDRKYQELKSIESEIKLLLDQQTEEENGRINSLVKVYEGMKAKDAARIFDVLDIDILVQVLSRMSERKLSPILASMNADRARSVTILLAEQKSFPSVPER